MRNQIQRSSLCEVGGIVAKWFEDTLHGLDVSKQSWGRDAPIAHIEGENVHVHVIHNNPRPVSSFEMAT